MSDKNLSKPVAWCDETALTLLREENFGVMMYPTEERGGDKALYSPEYVQSLLGRIESMSAAHYALQQLCDVYRAAYEEARGAADKVALTSHGLTVQGD